METRRKYRIETTPITVEREADGGSVTSMGSLNLRVVDVYTDMPIGSVLHVKHDAGPIAYHAYSHFFKSGPHDNRLDPPKGGWGPRFDLAAKALWKDYNRRLPWRDRTIRCIWRWQPQGWAFAMLVLGVFLTFLFQLSTDSNRRMHAHTATAVSQPSTLPDDERPEALAAPEVKEATPETRRLQTTNEHEDDE